SGTEWISEARVSPAGDSVAFVDHPRAPEHSGEVAIVGIAAKGPKRILCGTFASILGLAWRPDGREIWFTAARTGRAQELYAVSLSGKERVIARSAGSLVLDDISPDGKALLRRESVSFGVLGMLPPGGGERELSWLDGSVMTDLSAAGTTVLFGEINE